MDGVFGYRPKSQEERAAYARFLSLAERDPDGAYGRGAAGHLAATAVVLDRTGENVLLVKHKIFGAYCPPGGHSDGGRDPLLTAIRETKEETGIDAVPFSTEPVGFRALSVKAHTRRGASVPAHEHFVFVYLLTALNDKTVLNAEETEGVLFAPVRELKNYVSEPEILEFTNSALVFYRAETEVKARVFGSLPNLLVPWFRVHKRDLPWRREKTAYRVWLSEIMLQQTRVEAVREYYLRFLDSAPDVFALAALSEERLAKLWEGLGYYSRMRNLKKTAEIVASRFGGNFPEGAEELKKLPGIGDYTAGAIASIGFGKKAAAVDGNVVRVVARVTEDFTSALPEFYKKELKNRLEDVYPDGAESDFTESLMELGATVCLPNGEPLCSVCPMRELCLARKNGTVSALPVAPAKPERKVEKLTVFLLWDAEGRLAVRKRSEKGVLAGLYEFPNIQGVLGAEEAESGLSEWGFRSVKLCGKRKAKHVFTHLIWEMTVLSGSVFAVPPDVRFVSEAELNADIPLPSAFRKLL